MCLQNTAHTNINESIRNNETCQFGFNSFIITNPPSNIEYIEIYYIGITNKIIILQCFFLELQPR